MRWAALLKGVNVGGNRKLPMAELRAFLEGFGLRDVRTLLASGNAVFDADEIDGAALERHLAQAAQADLGLATEWLVRSGADLAGVVAGNPFPDAARERGNHLVVVFHRDPVPPGPLEALARSYIGPEPMRAFGRELFVDYVGSIGESKLPAAMARARFPAAATARNWNTVLKLAAATA